MKTYEELISLPTFKERFLYLKLNGKIAEQTFGRDRYLNQKFYSSEEWRRLRRHIILRDDGCDLAFPERTIFGTIYVHHINPITIEDVVNHSFKLVDPNNLISMSYETHYSITYGDERILEYEEPIIRLPNDTCPWRK